MPLGSSAIAEASKRHNTVATPIASSFRIANFLVGFVGVRFVRGLMGMSPSGVGDNNKHRTNKDKGENDSLEAE